MALKAIVENIDDVPEKHQDLYTEKDGKWHLTGVDIDQHPTVTKLKNENASRRIEAKRATEELKKFEGVDIEALQAAADRIPLLEAAAAGKVDETKLNEMAEARAKLKLAPVERELGQVKIQLAEKDKTIQTYTEKDRQRAIEDALRKAATGAKLLPEAFEDATLLAEKIFMIDEEGKVVTKDNVGTTPGVGPDVWLTEMQNKRPHWWGPTTGGGANGNRGGGGAGGRNPWLKEHHNLTEQGKIMKENPTRANQLAKAAGVNVDGTPLTK